ncbi:MAG: tyrosine-type recombinase/integrase [Acidobacteria bacterium]|nr:tyrosine-type recombinase/integrase [Acidobacteriota bacterium]
MREKPFDFIRDTKLIETQSEHFLRILSIGTISTNVFLRRLHNFALGMDWIVKAIIPKTQWPKIDFREKRGVTLEEHRKILAGERNAEWRAYYNVLWHVGGSQSDIANLCAEDVNWEDNVISYSRMKTGAVIQLHFGTELASVLSDLPGQGLLFPRIANMKESDRASLFRRRCRLVGISGVSLHSYRYSWAERARSAGYPERFAQEALGHNRAYKILGEFESRG